MPISKGVDQIRALAYGGTSYSERIRIGMWPEISSGAMGDRYGLQEDPLSVGVGLIEERPVLILRHLQDTVHRGGYPYTLLLDPGANAWREAGWNGAFLAASLLDDSVKRDLLLNDIEALNTGSLEGFAGNSSSPAAQPAADCVRMLRHLWLGAHLQDKRIVIGVANLTLAERILNPRILACDLATLPTCFRLGSGWLAGGGMVQANAFGCHVVFDSLLETEAAILESIVAEGRDLDAKWTELRESSASASLIENLSNIPMHEWPLPARDVLRAVRSGRVSVLRAGNQGARVDADEPTAVPAPARIKPAAPPTPRPARHQNRRDDVRRMAGRYLTSGAAPRRWLSDYVADGDDPDGTILWRLAERADDKTVFALVNEAVIIAADGPVHVRAWLKTLAASPLRRRVPSRIKVEIARAVRADWAPLLDLVSFWMGADNPVRPCAAAERSALLDDLDQLSLEHPCKTRTPNLEAIVMLFDGLPMSLQTRLARAEPPLENWAAARSWCRGWQLLSRDDVVRRELTRWEYRSSTERAQVSRVRS